MQEYSPLPLPASCRMCPAGWAPRGFAADKSLLKIVFDPQTSGGLLISVPEQHAEDLTNQIRKFDFESANIVGKVIQQQDHSLRLG